MNTKQMNTNKYAVPALEKSVAILEHLAKHRQGLSLSDLCQDLNLPKTTVFSILQTLESYSYVRKNSDGLYNLGLKLYSLGMDSIRHIDTQSTFVPYMERLRDETQFTVHLCAYDHGETVCIEKIEGAGLIRFQSYVGERKRMNTTAVGKVIMAYLPEEDLQLAFAKGFNSPTPNSITTESAMREHLKQVREHGYAIDDEEGEIGVRCIGVPIFMENGLLFGSISLSTLKSHLPVQKFSEYGEKLIAVGRELSQLLGYTGPYPRR